MYITFEINLWSFYVFDGFTLANSLFGAVRLTKNAYPDKYFYSGYGISFDVSGTFLLPNGGFGKNIVIFGADISLSVDVDYKKDSLILGKGPTQGLDNITVTVKGEYSY